MSSHIRMRHIRCFLAVARCGSVTAAAEQINTSQPALSRSLAELETIVGQPLFVRTGRGLSLTANGAHFQRHLETAVNQIEAGTQIFSGSFAHPKVAIGMLPNVARTLASDATGAFKAYAPDVDVELLWDTAAGLVSKLHQGRIDFILGRLLSLDLMPGLSFEHLYTEDIVFLCCSQHRFASRPDDITLADLEHELIVVPARGTIIRTEVDKFVTARGHTGFTNKVETVSFEFTRSFVTAQCAVACLPLGAVRQELASGRFVKLGLHGEELVGSVGISFIAGRALTSEAEQFAQSVREASKHLI